jgi:hypothetical protein
MARPLIAGRFAQPLVIAPRFVTGARRLSVSGWHTAVSTRDQRTREQREQDRRQRQLEKLPRPEALHDFQYPYEKRVLCDADFQPPVYASELDTPQLFNLFPPTDFFCAFSAADFDRSHYPTVPDVDVRAIVPGSPAWAEHRALADAYLRKHELVPQVLPHVSHSVNLSVVFGAAPEMRSALSPRNFWHSALLGNWMELKEAHGDGAPAIFMLAADNEAPPEAEEQLYTLLVVSPDYPCRAAPSDRFFLHYAVCDLTAQRAQSSASGSTTPVPRPIRNVEGAVPGAAGGTVVVPYVPPLPTEDAGCSRVVCALFPQTKRFADGKPAPAVDLPFAQRCSYRLHDPQRAVRAGSNARREHAHPVFALESVIDATSASAACFFQTSWDIQVQEWYEAAGLPEPRYYPDDIVDLLRYNALPLDAFQVSSRHTAAGAVQGDKDFEQAAPLLVGQNTASAGKSARTLLSRDGKPMQRPTGHY